MTQGAAIKALGSMGATGNAKAVAQARKKMTAKPAGFAGKWGDAANG